MARYVYACVRVPIEITEDGRQITHNDHSLVSFEECDKLPDLNKIDMKQAFKDYLQELEDARKRQTAPIVEEQEEPITILKSEIKRDAKMPLKNSTFKNRASSGYLRHTSKAR
jgi:hypothetical protein